MRNQHRCCIITAVQDRRVLHWHTTLVLACQGAAEGGHCMKEPAEALLVESVGMGPRSRFDYEHMA